MRQLVAFASSAESAALKEKLNKEKIPFIEMANSQIDVNPEATKAKGVKILVNDGDFEKAAKLL